MSSNQQSVRLFSLGSDIHGEPAFIDPENFKTLGVGELKDIERWIKKEPQLLGEELVVIAAQMSNWDKTSDRPDVLALDRRAKLVVVEIKRDSSGKDQDLQAIRYASYISTLNSDDVLELYRGYRLKEYDEGLSEEEALESLSDFVIDGSVEALNDDDQPRMILVAEGYQPGVTSTVLWLRNSYAMDVGCVQLQAYKLQGEIVLSSTTLIPLPEAAAYEVKMQSKRWKSAAKKRGVPLNKADAEAFIESIPDGHWASYGDVAAAGGSPKAFQGVASWLSSEKTEIPLVYRVLNVDGTVSKGWTAYNDSLPQTIEEVQAKLIEEGVAFEKDKANKEQRWSAEDWLKDHPQGGLAGEAESNGSSLAFGA